MSKFRLSSDILSPLHSDISGNDSIFSFGSLPRTPAFENDITSPVCSASAMDADVNILCTKTMRECTDAFNKITNDIGNQTNTYSGKEEYKRNFNELKKSTNDLFNIDDSSSSISSPKFEKQSKDEVFESKISAKTNIVTELGDSKNLNIQKKRNTPSDLTKILRSAEKKPEHCKTEKFISNKPVDEQHRSKRTSSESKLVKSIKNKHKSLLRNNAGASQKKNALTDQKIHSKVSSKDEGTSETKINPSEILPKGTKETKTDNTIKQYNFKCQTKIPVSEEMPILEQKNLSLEKRIQLAISMEMDNLRGFILHQNLFRHRELLKVQEMAKKQIEVTEHYFSTIDELLEANKRLISKFN